MQDNNENHDEVRAAELAQAWLDSIPKRIELMLLDGAYTHPILNIKKSDAVRFLGYVKDGLADSFADEETRLEAITGYRTAQERERETSRLMERIITNPATLKTTGAL